MNCEEFLRLLPGDLRCLTVEQELHAETCPSCAAVAEDRRSLADEYRALADEWKSISAPPDLESRVLAAFHLKLSVRGAGRSYLRFPVWAPAAAMIALLAAFLVSGHPAPQRRSQSEPGFSQPEPLTETPVEADDGFHLLPNAAQITPDEEVDIVRLEIPRSSVIALGYPVSEDKGSDKVEADVVLDADGTARAVRFVDE